MVDTSTLERSWQRFELENWQSDYEQTVRFNLSDSTIDPLPLSELLPDDDAVNRVLSTKLYYPEVNGERSLREAIAARYRAVHPDEVLVTVGASEANAAVIDALAPVGSRVIVMEPGYRQVWGLARNQGCDVVGFTLDPARGWRPDLAQLRELATPATSVIYVCNPNNPTGYILTDEEMTTIVQIADDCDAWILADEVYHGSEHDAEAPARSFVGLSDRVIGVNSMSKSFGLSGLRIGWATATPDVIAQLWRRHEYAAIATGRLDNVLATRALESATAERILRRNRAAMHSGWEMFGAWAQDLGDIVRVHRPMATSLAFLQIVTSCDSVEIGHRIREEASTLVCPGVYFGSEGFIRLNFGFGTEQVRGALEAMTPVIRRLSTQAAR